VDAVKGKHLARGSLARVWRFASPYRTAILVYLGGIVLSALLGLVPAFVFRAILDDAIPAGDRNRIWLLASIAVGAAVATSVLTVVQRWFSARIGEGLIYDLRVALFDKVQQMPIGFFTRTQTGALMSRLNNDVIDSQNAVTSTLGSVVSDGIVLITTLSAMLVLDWRLTILALVVLPVFVLPAKRVGRRLQKITRRGMALNAEMNTQMSERFNVSGALLVKLFGSHRREVRTFSERAAGVRDVGIQSAIVGRVFFVALGLVGAVGTAAIYGFGAQSVVSGTMKTGTLVALASLVGRVYAPLTGLTNARVDVMTSMVSFERVFEVLDAPVAITDKPSAIDLIEPRGRIELRHVDFRYPPASQISIPSLESPDAPIGDPDRDVLHDISMVVEAGETVAIVGPSGSGKSTLVSLIPRLYDVTSGAVLVDGHDVRDLTGDSLRASIGVVSQDPHLFHESIESNLLYAKPDATREELIEACTAARIHDTIAALPDGYATLVGERGYRMSGGEKQRIAIARLLLKDPAMMILDEATSALDNESEALVQAALDAALTGRTALVIAHRLSTIRDADRIVVIEHGAIVEHGTHAELLAAGGAYARQIHAGAGDAWDLV
jgi:ATP-binding cassette subfamily B protein